MDDDFTPPERPGALPRAPRGPEPIERDDRSTGEWRAPVEQPARGRDEFGHYVTRTELAIVLLAQAIAFILGAWLLASSGAVCHGG